MQNWCEWVENTSLTKPCLASVIQAKSPLTHPVARQYALLRIAGKRMIEASRVVKILWRHLILSLGHLTLNTALYSSQWRVGLDDAGYYTPVLAILLLRETSASNIKEKALTSHVLKSMSSPNQNVFLPLIVLVHLQHFDLCFCLMMMTWCWSFDNLAETWIITVLACI